MKIGGSAAALERAQRRFGHIPGAQIEVCSSAGSGQEPIVCLRHAQANPTAVDVQVHFHGDQLYDQEAQYERKIGEAVERAWQKSPNTLFLLPEAANENAAPRSNWKNISDLRQLTHDGLQKLGLSWANKRTWTISGHSAGGSVIAKALARPDALSEVTRFELYDAAVSSQHNPVSEAERKKVKAWCQDLPEQFLVVPGTMKSSWLDYIERSRWTAKASDHWSPLWDSLGQFRSPQS